MGIAEGCIPKVAVVTPGTFPVPSPRSSSVERVVENVTHYLTGQAALWIFGKAEPGLPVAEMREGMMYFRYPGGDKHRYLHLVSRKISELAPNLIQIENRPRSVTFFKKRHPSIPVWLSLHSITYLTKPHIGASELRKHLMKADRIIVNSYFLRNYVVRRYPILNSKVEVNHLGVDETQFICRWTPEGEALRQQRLEELGLTGRKIILYAGRLIPIKGVHHLLPILSTLRGREPDTLLIIVGSAFYGSHRTTAYVRKLFKAAARLSRHVKFIPFVPYDQMQAWFQIADVVVVPSSRNEAFGLVNVEAMAAGVPVVATRSGGMGEIVEEGMTGYLVRPDRIQADMLDRLLRLLGDPELRRQLGEASKVRAERHFTWRGTAERLLRMYRAYL
ncbi:hypothetical protein SY83_07225 [Paenibacillus swuensis]|uniref:Glycosyl transferase family 1 n=1 Tax=Paenibacillus swuensis TaxID=1178515 RepID=A0A172TGB2_9BACL|nr:glycosyltransferase family 4 protein [Paenibacillus swuensis]ANE46105.1 hypothetical protein SY83_07225 [Paenibacillus swuensis]